MRFLLFLYLMLFAQTVLGATISGLVRDEQGRALSNVNIVVQPSGVAVISNAEGHYQLHLEDNTYNLTFKCIGYQTEIINIALVQDTTFNISLKPEVYELPEVSVSASMEDPAYDIIREAIRKRKTHLNELKTYTCRVYTKGSQRLLKAPKRFAGINLENIAREYALDSNRTGILYLSESEAVLYARPPHQFHEEIIASKVSGNQQAATFNRVAELFINLYENNIDFKELIPRGIVSPIADNAMQFYRYHWEGTMVSAGQTIHKIEILPRQPHAPAFRGYIYIIDDEWRIYGADLLLTQSTQMQIIKELSITQHYAPVQNTWQLSSQYLSFHGGIASLKFAGDYTYIFSQYVLNPPLPDKLFKGERLHIQPEAGFKDSIYWTQNRPIPLTAEEKRDYHRKDSLAVLRQSAHYLDSLDRFYNEFNPSSLVLGGAKFRRRSTGESWYISPLVPDNFQFNSVEGFNYTLTGWYKKDLAEHRALTLQPLLHYGFSNHLLSGNLSAYYRYNPLKSASVSLKGGSEVSDFNNRGSIGILFNSFNNLLNEENFLKLYERRFISLNHSREPMNGLQINLGLDYSDRVPLVNATDYTWVNSGQSRLTANNPYYGTDNNPAFERNQALSFSFNGIWSPGTNYETRPEGRVYTGNKWPQLALTYKAGLNILGSDVKYHYLCAKIYDLGMRMGLWGSMAFNVSGGGFLSNEAMWYMDYQQFKGNRLQFYEGSSNSVFRFLDYYEYSTNQYFVEGHLEHNFSGLLTHRVPWLRKLRLEEVAGINYLYTSDLQNYTEVYVGVQRLMFRLEYGFSWMAGDAYLSGFRLSTSF